MTIARMTRPARSAQLVAGVLLVLLLAISGFLIGSVAIGFTVNAIEIFMKEGVEQGMNILFMQVAFQSIVDFGTGFSGANSGSLQSIAAYLVGGIATCLVLFLYPLIWLNLARTALSWLKNGMWAFQEELLPDDFPGDWRNPSEVLTLLSENKVRREDISEAGRLLLGANAPYTPTSLRSLLEKLSEPSKRAFNAAIKLLFWFALTVACIFAAYLQVFGESGVAAIDNTRFAVEFGVPLLKPAAIWMVVAMAFATLAGFLDFRFARALVPNEKPKASSKLSTLRRRTVDNPPAQFNSIFNSEIRMKIDDVRYRAIGFDDTRESFKDQSNFKLDVMIEGTSQRLQPYMAGAAKARLFSSSFFMLAGAAFLLIGLFPSSILSALAEEKFSLSNFYTSPVWVVLVLATGNVVYRYGQSSFWNADTTLQQGWFKTPVVHLRLDGTVNTQTASAGKGINDSLGAEFRAQQSHFETTITSATIISDAHSLDGDRNVWSFDADALSEDLEFQVVETLKLEGTGAQVSNVISTATEAAKLKTALMIKQNEAELNDLMIETERQRLKLSDEGNDNA